MGTRGQHRLGLCLLLSLLLHLLTLVMAPRWWGGKTPVLRLRHQAEDDETARFEPRRALRRSHPSLWTERLVVKGQPEKLKAPAAPTPPALRSRQRITPALPRARQPVSGGKGESFVAPADSLISIRELGLAAHRLRARDLAGYQRLRLPDTDTDDARSEARRRGEQVVLAAVEAMGGVRALNQLRGMTLAPASEPSHRSRARMARYLTEAEITEKLLLKRAHFRRHGLRSQFVQYLPGAARLMYDGAHAWVVLPGARHQLQGQSFQVAQNRGERWDFLSRYMGDGVRVEFLGRQKSALGRLCDVVHVEDYKFGGVSFRALVDAGTRLPVAEEYPADDPALRHRFLSFGQEGEAWVWHQLARVELRAGRHRDTLSVAYGSVPDAAFESPAQRPHLTIQGKAES